jgi:hypothetical protein
MLKIDLKVILILLLIVVIVLLQFCKRENPNDIPEPIVVRDTTYIRDTFKITKPGKTIYKDTTIYSYISDTVPVDTSLILKEFFAKNVYKDTIRLKDSLGTLVIEDTISRNEIQFRTITADIKTKIIKETTILPYIPKRQLYWGLQGNFDKISFINSVSVGAIYKSKQDILYVLNVGLSNNKGTSVTPYVGGGMYWKIKLK